jgi:hypothetical protein
MVSRKGTFDFDPAIFGEIADPILAFFAATEFAPTRLVPLQGLQCQVDEIELSDGTTLRRLSDEEISVLLTWDVIPTAPLQDARILDEANQWCVAQVTTVPKTVSRPGAPPVPPDLSNWPPSIIDAAERLVTAVRLEVGGMVMGGPLVSLGTLGPGGDSSGAGVASAPVAHPKFVTPSALSPADMPDVMTTWQALDRSEVRTAKAVQIALRRIRDTPQYPHPEDLLIDVMIAAEAFFLSDTDDQSQIGFRLGLLAALYVEMPGRRPSEIRRFMSKAYGARSTIVHGGEPKARDLLRVEGNPGTVKEVAEDLEAFMRRALRRAVRDANGVAPPNWNAMLVSFLDREAQADEAAASA